MSEQQQGRAARLLEPFRSPKSRRLLAAFLVSELGDGSTFIVIPLGVYAVSNDLVALAGTFLGRLLFASAFAALGGAVADRWDRRRILLVSYVVRALLVVALMLVPQDEAVVFALLGILVGASGSFDNPAAEASLRTAYRHDLQSLAAARKTGKTLSALVGPALGGFLFGAGGIQLALGVNVAAFVIALIVLYPGRQRSPAPEFLERSERRETRRLDWRVVGRVPRDARLAFVSALTGSFLVGLATVVAVPYLDGLDHAPPGAYGYAIAVYSVGALAGLWFAGIADWKRYSLRVILVVANLVYGLLVVLSVAVPAWEVLALAWLLWGVAFGPEDVVADARVSAVVPDRWLGRVYAWWSIVSKLGSALAFGGAALLGAADTRVALLVAGCVYAVVVPVSLWLLGHRSRTP
ncbi:hypothetical protein BKD30_04065 [Tersicoccus phoenicis]|uniref:Major facilitator superfamily (MFS) profile domain-containing protein n=1 Tax=Tersicoccus phoenicis TaxID=554083 RepID=A0A1R1LHQ7_9MICC|nr:MFS transporter [Tersicoccus phoenicis]OMH27071.1 hypothetical protein BKD30_04065 [Tersicoccus phoenicis]